MDRTGTHVLWMSCETPFQVDNSSMVRASYSLTASWSLDFIRQACIPRGELYHLLDDREVVLGGPKAFPGQFGHSTSVSEVRRIGRHCLLSHVSPHPIPPVI